MLFPSILRTPKKSRRSRRSGCPAARRPVVGEITGALVTSEYHCSGCGSKIPSWKPKCFSVRCPGCKTSWKCAKIQCRCKAKVTLEKASGELQRVMLYDSLLRSIVSVQQCGYCKTESIEKKLLKFGHVRVEFDNGIVKSVTKILPNSTFK